MNIEGHLASVDFYVLKFFAICITVCELFLAVCALDYAVPGIDPRLRAWKALSQLFGATCLGGYGPPEVFPVTLNLRV